MTKEDARRVGREMLDPEAAEELAKWRGEHPKATLKQIEEAVERATARLRAGLVEALVSGGEEGEALDPHCPRCGGGTQSKGREVRRLKASGEAEVALERERRWCPSCGVGFFPP